MKAFDFAASARDAWRRLQDREPVSSVGGDLLKKTTYGALDRLRRRILVLLGDGDYV
jgi:hypothetical protein